MAAIRTEIDANHFLRGMGLQIDTIEKEAAAGKRDGLVDRVRALRSLAMGVMDQYPTAKHRDIHAVVTRLERLLRSLSEERA
jgi:hypothetical protein